MKRSLLILMVSYLALVMASGCDDDSGGAAGPVPNSVQVNGIYVTYDATGHKLVAHVTATVLDEDVNPVPGAIVSVVLEGDNGPYSGETDENGTARIEIPWNAIQTVDGTISANRYVGENPNLVQAPITVNFDYTMEGDRSSVRQGMGEACRDVTLTFSDDDGFITGVEVHVDVYDGTPTEAATVLSVDRTTDSEGAISFELCSDTNGEYVVAATLPGIEGLKTYTALIHGPIVAGTIESAQKYRNLTSPRAGVMLVDVQILEDEPEQALKGELVSQAISVCPTEGKGSYGVYLPPRVDDAFLPDSADGTSFGVFVPFVYDDTNGNGAWDPAEPIAAMRMTTDVPVYFKGSGSEGWFVASELSDNAQITPMGDGLENLDMIVTRAPVYSPVVEGTVDVGPLDLEPTQVTVALVVINGNERVEEAFQHHNFRVIATTTPEANGHYSLEATSIENVLQELQMTDWSVNDGDISQLFVLLVMYHDSDGNGEPSLDEIFGTLKPPFGTTGIITYITAYPDWMAMYQPETVWIHYGYNYVTFQQHVVLERIINSSVWEVDTPLERGHTDVPFTLTTGDGPAKCEGLLSTDATGMQTIIVDATACTDATPGDTLVIRTQDEEVKVRDWGEQVDCAFMER